MIQSKGPSPSDGPFFFVTGTLRACPRKELPVAAPLAEPKSPLRAARREDATERLIRRS